MKTPPKDFSQLLTASSAPVAPPTAPQLPATAGKSAPRRLVPARLTEADIEFLENLRHAQKLKSMQATYDFLVALARQQYPELVPV